MAGRESRSRSVTSQLLLGRDRGRTRRALLLAVGFLVVGSVLALTIRSAPDNPAAAVLRGFQNAFVLETDIDLLAEVAIVPGTVVVVGLAALHASLNEGYLPSLVLASAPVYGTYVFTVYGPVTGIVVPVTDEAVFAPTWAAIHVLPNTVAYGTIGFLLGLAFRYLGQQLSARGEPVPAGRR